MSEKAFLSKIIEKPEVTRIRGNLLNWKNVFGRKCTERHGWGYEKGKLYTHTHTHTQWQFMCSAIPLRPEQATVI